MRPVKHKNMAEWGRLQNDIYFSRRVKMKQVVDETS